MNLCPSPLSEWIDAGFPGRTGVTGASGLLPRRSRPAGPGEVGRILFPDTPADILGALLAGLLGGRLGGALLSPP